MRTAAVLQLTRSMPLGTLMDSYSWLSKLRMRALPIWMYGGQAMRVSGMSFSHQSAATASLKTDPGGA